MTAREPLPENVATRLRAAHPHLWELRGWAGYLMSTGAVWVHPASTQTGRCLSLEVREHTTLATGVLRFHDPAAKTATTLDGSVETMVASALSYADRMPAEAVSARG